MQTIFRLLTLVLVGALPVLIHPGSAYAAEEILDQAAQTETDDWSWIEDYYMGQIFTAGRYGYLTRISVYLENDSTNPATTPIMVSIQTIAGGVPSGNAAAFGQISPGNIPTSEGWVDVNLNEYMLVAEGTQYAIILSTSTGRVKWYGYFSSWEDNYDRGNVVVSYDNGVNWLNKFTYDMAFKMYVIPDTLDQAQTDDSTWCMYFADTQPAGQTFTAGLHGALNRVSVKLRDYENNPASGPIIVSIQTTTEQGLPSGEEVGRGEIPLDKIPAYGSGGQWIDVGINPVSNSPVAMESGTEYAFLLIPSEGAACWYQSQSDVYDGGSLMTRLGVGWMTTHEPFDGAFETYILEPVLDQNVDQQNYIPSYITIYGFLNYWTSDYDKSYAQVFTAGKSGFLSRVSINMGGVRSDGRSLLTGPVTVRILPVGWDGVPLYDVLAVGTIPFAETQTKEGWVDAWLSPLFYVNKGQRYAIKVTPAHNFPDMVYWYRAAYYYSGNLFRMNYDIWEVVYEIGMFRTYVLPFKSVMQSGFGIEPCANDVCPEVSGGFTPADFTGGVKGHFDFRERTDGTVKGVLKFTDQRQEGFVLHGCTTDSAACQLTVTTLDCTDQHALTVEGTYTPKGGDVNYYELNLSGVRDGIGTFTLKSGEYDYTLTRKGIVDVTCPPIGASP